MKAKFSSLVQQKILQLNEAPRANARGIFSLASAERNLAEAENSHSSTVSQPWSSAKADKKDKKLIVKIEKQIKLFESDPKHPSLHTHKLTGNLANRWSISISRGLRMVYLILEKDIAYFVDLGTHDEVYKK